MSALILSLQLGLLISFGFTEASEDHTRAEPNLDLECVNDYLTEMMCRLTPDQLHNCSEYSLNVSRHIASEIKFYQCDFKLYSSMCECSFQVASGFVLTEIFRVEVLRRKKLLFIKNVSTTESIKPKKPAIMSVTQTQNGNFHIVWDTEYRTKEIIFDSELIPELIYYVEGSNKSRRIENLPKGQKDYELIGRNLESNSNYIVMARVKFVFSPSFSDYSDPYRFTTSSSLKDILKIIIPVVCIILMISIFAIYYSYSKILTEWWEKIPTPKITTSFVKQVPNLLSFQNEFSPVHLDSSKLVHAGEKTWPAASLVDVRGENSLSSLGKDGNSADVIYGQTGNESLEETSMGNTNPLEFFKESEKTSLHQIPMSNKYKTLKSSSDDYNVEKECGNTSGISNKLYMLSLSNNPATVHICSEFSVSEKVFPALAKNLDPMILTDFEYSPCTGTCVRSENNCPTQLTPSSNSITVVPGFQSNDEVDCTSIVEAFISSHINVNPVMDKIICIKNPKNISTESTIMPAENGYKELQSLLRNSGEQILTTEPELKHLCDPSLHTVPGIQIDCNYHMV